MTKRADADATSAVSAADGKRMVFLEDVTALEKKRKGTGIIEV
jgi:hypothetical protein